MIIGEKFKKHPAYYKRKNSLPQSRLINQINFKLQMGEGKQFQLNEGIRELNMELRQQRRLITVEGLSNYIQNQRSDQSQTPDKINYILYNQSIPINLSLFIMSSKTLINFTYCKSHFQKLSLSMSFNLSQTIQKLKLQDLDDNQNLFFIQKYLGVKPSSFLIALITFVIIVALTSNATGIVVSLTCCLIPAYFTFVALQSPNQEDSIKYLTYWIIFAAIELISPVLSLVLSSLLYIFLRIGLTVVLLHPSLNMTVKIYREYVEPELRKLQNSIDVHIQRGKSLAEDQYKRFARN